MANYDPKENENNDKAHANEDRAAIEKYSQNTTFEGWIDTPYVKLLFSEFFAQASHICAVDFGNQLMQYDNKIRKLYSALEMKVLNQRRLRSLGEENPKGYIRDMNAIDNFRITLFETIDEKGSMISTWRKKMIALIDTYNERIARYIDDITAVKSVVVAYPQLDESDLPGLFTQELALVESQRTQYNTRVMNLIKEVKPREENQ